jgi:hypothetical protein
MARRRRSPPSPRSRGPLAKKMIQK